MKVFTEESTTERGIRGGKCWGSFYDAMTAKGFNETTLARELGKVIGESVTARRIDAYLYGQRKPDAQTLLAISRLIGCGVEELISDCPKKNIRRSAQTVL